MARESEAILRPSDASDMVFDPNPVPPHARASWAVLGVRLLDNSGLGFDPLQTPLADLWLDLGPNLHEGLQFVPNVTTGVTTEDHFVGFSFGFPSLFGPLRGHSRFSRNTRYSQVFRGKSISGVSKPAPACLSHFASIHSLSQHLSHPTAWRRLSRFRPEGSRPSTRFLSRARVG